VPALAALGWRQAEAVACVFLGAGMAGLAAAVGAGDVLSIRAAGAVVSVGALALGAALGRILWHLVSSRRAGTSRHARPIAEAPAQGNRIVAPAALTARTATTSAMPAAGAPAAAAAARR
jgi:Na+/H+ antiporter NhaC